jgi:putative nucleotidyltransferase with HDIG domain
MSIHVRHEAERSRASNAQRVQPMRPALRRREAAIAAAYLAAAVALPVFGGLDGSFSPATAALYVIAIAAAGQVRFDVGAGFTVPTQALFVPFLFAVPASLVPLLVPVALALGMLPRIMRAQVSPSWLLTAAGNSWFAVGPATVLVLAHDNSPIGRWEVLILALAAQFACDFIASAVRVRLHGDLTLGELAQEVRPIYAIDSALSLLGLTVAFAVIPAHSQLVVLLVMPLFIVLRIFSQERHERLSQLAELNDAYQGTALLLGDVIEADDAYTGEHCRSVVRLALEVAEQLGLGAERKRNVEFAALLHDVGKIAVPKEIINKPGRLDEREWAIVKTHTLEGQRMLARIGGFMREIGHIVRASHERWDGNGYPDGLIEDAIPIEARIVCACDAFNAMTTTRPYRSAMTLLEAVAELKRCAGSQFDPRVVESLLRVVSGPLEQTLAEPDRQVGDGHAGAAEPRRAPVAGVAKATLPMARPRLGSLPREKAGAGPAGPRRH